MITNISNLHNSADHRFLLEMVPYMIFLDILRLIRVDKSLLSDLIRNLGLDRYFKGALDRLITLRGLQRVLNVLLT